MKPQIATITGTRTRSHSQPLPDFLRDDPASGGLFDVGESLGARRGDDGADAFGLNNPLISGCYIAAPAVGITAAASYRKVTVAAGESTLLRYP
jgi:hypothetical protein